MHSQQPLGNSEYICLKVIILMVRVVPVNNGLKRKYVVKRNNMVTSGGPHNLLYNLDSLQRLLMCDGVLQSPQLYGLVPSRVVEH